MSSTVVVETGPITWMGHVIACRECGGQDRWMLRTEQIDGLDGELASLECGSGHREEHPLIYPRIMARVAEWSQHPDAHRMQWQQLRDWEPHWPHREGGELVYRPWTVPGPIDWSAQWPELVEAARWPEKIAEWQAHASDTDMSFQWLNRWGTTEPDRTHIELEPAVTRA